MNNRRLPAPPILLVTDRAQAQGDLIALVAAVLAGGLRWVSVREKDLPEAEQAALVRALRPIADAHGARLTLHGSAALAHSAGADGVHLPGGADPVAARALLGPEALIGLSVHGVAEAAAADDAALDYLVAGPAFETASKPGYGPALGADGLRALRAASPLPLIAIGGIGAAQMSVCRAGGASGVAVMGGLMRAADPAVEARALIAAWG